MKLWVFALFVRKNIIPIRGKLDVNIYAFELNNDIKGISERKKYIEQLLMKVHKPDFIVLPELALCSYMGSNRIWRYADYNSVDTSKWAVEMAGKYNTYIAVGFLEKRDNDYYNSYLIANKEKVYGIIRKSEGEAYIFKRGNFPNIIPTPLGNVAIGICYDARRKHFYENIKNQTISLILFPHGSPSDPMKIIEEKKVIDYICNQYLNAFDVPVVYNNSKGKLDFMLGSTGKMMMKAGFALNGLTTIYSNHGTAITTNVPEIIGRSVDIKSGILNKSIPFHGKDIIKGNWMFRMFVLQPDIQKGIYWYRKR